MPETPRRSRSSGPTKSPDFPVSTPQQSPSGDYSYTVELVGTIQKEIGGLIEAVNSLKEQSKEHGKELKDLSKDFHAVKVTGKTLLWLIGIVGAILGIFLTAYARQLFGAK
jgi:phosphotransferase system  glucose/maltose/N-acetylglucosamine-specific IIC component